MHQRRTADLLALEALETVAIGEPVAVVVEVVAADLGRGPDLADARGLPAAVGAAGLDPLTADPATSRALGPAVAGARPAVVALAPLVGHAVAVLVEALEVTDLRAGPGGLCAAVRQAAVVVDDDRPDALAVADAGEAARPHDRLLHVGARDVRDGVGRGARVGRGHRGLRRDGVRGDGRLGGGNAPLVERGTDAVPAAARADQAGVLTPEAARGVRDLRRGGAGGVDRRPDGHVDRHGRASAVQEGDDRGDHDDRRR